MRAVGLRHIRLILTTMVSALALVSCQAGNVEAEIQQLSMDCVDELTEAEAELRAEEPDTPPITDETGLLLGWAACMKLSGAECSSPAETGEAYSCTVDRSGQRASIDAPYGRVPTDE